MRPKAFLKHITYPDYGIPEHVPAVSSQELTVRLHACRQLMASRGYSHLLVYADREHFANLAYLTGFDARFEEALLILHSDNTLPLILVGNEGEGHLGASPLHLEGLLRHLRYQPFSLQNQPRERLIDIVDVFKAEGLNRKAKVGLVGWKYYENDGFASPLLISDMPSYIVDIVRSLVGREAAENATDLFISPAYGLRTTLSPYEVAWMEYSNYMGCQAVKAILANFEAGKTDFELMAKAPFTGYPFACHPSIKSIGNLHYSLTSPTGDVIERGRPGSISIAYWGSNICRAGWVVASQDELPEKARNYVDDFVAPYMEGIACWLEALRIGTLGGELYALIQRVLPFDQFCIYLNPGHLIHMDEWTSSPIFEGSTIPLRSGMCIQIDIIPRSSAYSSTRMEEGVLLADEALQEQLKTLYPAVYNRCMQRRAFMELLGYTLPQEVLPLSDMAGIIVPYFLDYQNIMTFK